MLVYILEDIKLLYCSALVDPDMSGKENILLKYKIEDISYGHKINNNYNIISFFGLSIMIIYFCNMHCR